MNAFVDTNILIAKCFTINSLYFKANQVFKEYDNLYISNCVKLEFNKIYNKNFEYFYIFFTKLLNKLFIFDDFECSFKRLYSFLKSDDFFQTCPDTFIILKNFWEYYINGGYVLISVIRKAIKSFLKTFSSDVFRLSEKLLKDINLTPQRLKSYFELKERLEILGVHYPDYEIVLDAYDFNVNYCVNLDFVTFDKHFEKLVKIFPEFSFKDVKGVDDYL